MSQAVLHQGSLEKYGGSQTLFSRWSKRHFVLSANKLEYFTSASCSPADKKGEFILDANSFVSHKSNMDKREFVFVLHAKGHNRQELLLSAPDFSALSSWEAAINAAVLELKKRATALDLQSSANFSGNRESMRAARLTERQHSHFKSDENENADEEPVLKQDKLEKRGQQVKTWTTRWFQLTDKRISYYSDEKYIHKKGERVLDIYSSVKRKPDEGNRTNLFALYTGLAEVELLMCASSASAVTSWMESLTDAIETASTAATYMSVDVSVCTSYIQQVTEPIYKISVQTYRGCLETFHHFADIRDAYNRLLTLAPSLTFENPFPQSYKKSSFGGRAARLTAEMLEDRRRRLAKWLQEVFEAFPTFKTRLQFGLVEGDSDDESVSDTETDADADGGSDEKGEKNVDPPQASPLQVAIAALFGCTPQFLAHEYTIEKHLLKVNLEDVGRGMADVIESICEQHGILCTESPKPRFVRKRVNDDSSKLVELFNELHVKSSSSTQSDAGIEDEEDEEEDEDLWLSGTPTHSLPSTIDELLQLNIVQLGELCRLKNINLIEFKAKRQYIRALLYKSNDSSAAHLQYKDARAEMKKLLSAPPGQATTLLVDTIWGDLLRRLGVATSLHTALMYSYNTEEKLSLLSQTVAVWDNVITFTKEDFEIITHLSMGRSINSLLLLALKYRIKQSTMKNQWIRKFSASRGIVALLTVLQTRLHSCQAKIQMQIQIPKIDAADMLQVLYCFHFLVCSDGLVAVQETSGVFESLASCVMLLEECQAVARQALEIFAEMIIFGMESSTVWMIKHSFERVAFLHKQAPFEVLVSALETGDVQLQSSVMILLNCMLIYENSIESRVKMRNALMDIDFEFKCSVVIRKFAVKMKPSPSPPPPGDGDLAIASNDAKSEDECYMTGHLTRIDADEEEEGGKGGSGWFRPPSVVTKQQRYSVQGERGKKLLYVLKNRELSWKASVGTDTSVLKMSDVTDILEFSFYPSLQPQSETFMLLDKDGGHICFDVDSADLKQQWCAALNHARLSACNYRNAYELPQNTAASTSDIARLQHNFEIHHEIFQTLAREDELALYASGFTSATTSSLDLALLLRVEFKRNKSETQFKLSLGELVAFALDNFSPRQHVKENAPHKNIHPAVSSSPRPIPQAPPLPYVPPPKPLIAAPTGALKLKPLYWSKIKPVNVAHTIWQELDEPDIDVDNLLSRFQQKSSVKKKAASSQNQSNDPAKKSNISKSISLYDANRVQNVAIASAKLKKTPEEIVDMVVMLNPDELTQDTTDIVKNLLIPTPEESKIVRFYKGNVEDLDFTGKLFSLFLGIDRLHQRLSCQRIMLNWHDGADMASAQLQHILSVLRELNTPECLAGLQALFATTLAVGNQLNGGSSRGQAHGFTPDLLLKLKTVRATHGRGSLLHFIAEQMSVAYPTLPLFYSSWEATWKAGKLNMKNVDLVMRELQMGLTFCEEELEAAEEIENTEHRRALVDRLEGFLMEASHNYDTMCELFEQANKTLVKTQLFIGDALTCANSTDDPLQQLFNMLLHVAEAHSQAMQDISDWKHSDSKAKNTRYTKSKRSSRIQLEDGLNDMGIGAAFSLHGGGKGRGTAGSAGAGAGGGQSEMLRQMKEQMSKMRKRHTVLETMVEESVTGSDGGGSSASARSALLLGEEEEDVDSDELL